MNLESYGLTAFQGGHKGFSNYKMCLVLKFIKKRWSSRQPMYLYIGGVTHTHTQHTDYPTYFVP